MRPSPGCGLSPEPMHRRTLLSARDSALRPVGSGRIQQGFVSSTVHRSRRSEPCSETSLYLVLPGADKLRGLEPYSEECERAAAFERSGAPGGATRCRREGAEPARLLHRPRAT